MGNDGRESDDWDFDYALGESLELNHASGIGNGGRDFLSHRTLTFYWPMPVIGKMSP